MNTNLASRVGPVLLVLAGLLTAGCNGPAFSVYRSPAFQPGRVRRVLALPFQHETQYVKVGDQMRSAVAAEVQAAGVFEVIQAPPRFVEVLTERTRMLGRFDQALVTELGKQFNADALMVATITHYNPYGRPMIGLKLQLIDTGHDGILWAADGLWDSSLRWTCARMRGFHLVRYRTSDSMDGWKIARLSPDRFHRFVAWELVGEMRPVPLRVASH